MTAPYSTPSTTTVIAKPVTVTWEVIDATGPHTVTVRSGAEPFCPCEKYQFNRKMWGEGKCAHTEAVQAERQKRGLAKKH